MTEAALRRLGGATGLSPAPGRSLRPGRPFRPTAGRARGSRGHGAAGSAGRTLGLAAVLLGGIIAATPGRAHPHVFIDGGVDFLFDSAGELARLRITWIYDPMTSLFILEDLGIDATQPLKPADHARIAAYDTEWEPGYAGDSYLWDGERRVGLSGPREPAAEIRNSRVVIAFLRDLDAPYRPGSDTRADVYDPSYYMAYMVTETPRLEGPHDGCWAEVEHFEPTKALAPLQQSLRALSAEETPSQADVGALFAEKVHLACD